MDELISKYRRRRKQKTELLLNFIFGIVLFIYTFIYSIINYFYSQNTVNFLIMFVVICFFFTLFIFWYKIQIIYGPKSNFHFNYLLNINGLYSKKIKLMNITITEELSSEMSHEQLTIFYEYLCNTKSNINIFKMKDILLMSFSFIIGASFTEKSLISTDLLSNAFYSVIGLFLGTLPFLVIFIKMYMAYNNLLNDNIIKDELVNNLSEIKYNLVSKNK